MPGKEADHISMMAGTTGRTLGFARRQTVSA